MTKGFEKAASSFAGFINRKISLAHSNIILISHDDQFSYLSGEEGTLSVLTTEIIGELSVLSFLILSDAESNEISRAVSPDKDLSPQLQEALLLEIDNIISASVIAQLANALQIEIYGDVPSLQHVDADNIQEFLRRRVADNPGQLSTIICNTTFVLNDKEHIHPQFVWKLNARIIDVIREHLATV